MDVKVDIMACFNLFSHKMGFLCFFFYIGGFWGLEWNLERHKTFKIVEARKRIREKRIFKNRILEKRIRKERIREKRICEKRIRGKRIFNSQSLVEVYGEKIFFGILMKVGFWELIYVFDVIHSIFFGLIVFCV